MLDDRELKKVFRAMDKEEETSVDFQTVWRKANRKSWLNRYFHSLKYNLALLCTLLILAPLAGSFLINPPSPNDSGQENSRFYSSIVIQGSLTLSGDEALVQGESELPAGTVLQAEVFTENKEAVLDEQKVVIQKDGSFSTSIQLPDKNKDYLIRIELFPHLQEENIKEVLGSKGEYLYSSSQVSGVYHYYNNNELHTGIRLHGEAERQYEGKSRLLFGTLSDMRVKE